MNLWTIILAVFALLAIGFMLAVFIKDRRRWITVGNAYNGTRTRQCTLNRTLDAAVGQRYLLAKEGNGGDDADICGATDRPIGYFDDEGAIGDKIAIRRDLKDTWLGIAAVAVAIGDKLYNTPAGKVTNVPIPGCYAVGYALSAVSGGEASAGGDSAIVEYDPCCFGEQFIYRGKITLGGGAATEAIAITGLTAAHHVAVTINDNNGNEDLQLLEATAGAGTLTVRFQEDPGDGAVIDVTIAPVTTTADNGA